jgi:pimeloyl-ACP methyl ester carboxylesterase
MVALNSLEFGTGRPLVILHGLFGSARNWASIARALSDHHRVIALDQRNHGLSPWSDEMDYPALAADLRDAVAPLGRCALVGHSMGGKAAMTFALLYPGLVERLAVVDIAPVSYIGRQHGDTIRAMRALDLSSVTRRAEVEEALRSDVDDPSIRAFLLQNLEPAPEGGMRWRLNLAVLQHALPTIMDWPEPVVAGRHYDGPTLFLAGGRSDYITPEAQPAIRGYFPRARLETMPASGHWPHAEQPETFLGLLRSFLQSG